MRLLSSFLAVLCAASWSMAGTYAPRKLVSAAAGGCGVTYYCDDFNRADVNPIGSPWANPTFSSNPLQIVSGKVAATSNLTDNYAYYNNTFADNQYSQIYVGESEGDSSSYMIGVTVRCASGSSKSLYTLMRSGVSSVDLWKHRNGSWLPLGSWAASFTGGKTMRLEVTGTSSAALKIIVGGTEVTTYTDSTDPLTSGYAGLYSSGVGEYIDDWQGGNL